MENCPYCGKSTTQLDLTQKDANARKWHCWCADVVLAEYEKSKEVKDANL